jgi:hypothetical protein
LGRGGASVCSGRKPKGLRDLSCSRFINSPATRADFFWLASLQVAQGVAVIKTEINIHRRSYHVITLVFLLSLGACVVPSNSYANSNTPQEACQRLGIDPSSPSWNDCLIKMAQSDRDAANADKLIRCNQARQNQANGGGGFLGGFIAAQNTNLACQ